MLIGWHPGHTRHAVATDLGEGLGIQNDQGQQTLANCKVGRVEYLRTFRRTKLQKTLSLSLRTRIDERMYLQVHLLGVMFHSGPVRLREEWGSPPEIKIIFIGINLTGVLEICAEDACQSLVGAIFFQQYGTNPIINHTGV